MFLGTKFTLNELLEDQQENYRNVEYLDDLIEDFYTARQNDKEDVTSWACRIEGLLHKLKERDPINRRRDSRMLHSKLWKGLRPESRNSSGHKFDRITDYGELKESRTVECRCTQK